MTFLEPWETIEQSEPFQLELVREMATTHPLFGKEIRAIARRIDCDDVLFRVVNDDEQSFAVVHLTWTGKVEAEGYPVCEFFESLQQFEANRMIHDNQMY